MWWRHTWVHIALVTLAAVIALFLILRQASGAAPGADRIAAGHQLAEAWCATCHVIEATTAGASHAAPDFVQVANLPSTTALSLKVFLRSNHPSMPNLVLTPDQTDDVVNYILSLKRN
jgi:mono/diheme cytochrome c family protein